MHDARAQSEILTPIGVIGALAISGLLAVGFSGIGQVNVALTLALLVAAIAASGGRMAGAATGAAAAISYNFFHTEPIHSLRIDHPRDVLTVVLLAAVGLAIGELGRQRNRSRWIARRSDIGLDRVVRMAELARTATDEQTLVAAVEEEIRIELRLAEVQFEPGATAGEDRPILDHRGVFIEPTHVSVGDEFAVARTGVDLDVSYQGQNFGRLVLTPQRPIGLAIGQLRCAVAIADQLAAALATMRPELA